MKKYGYLSAFLLVGLLLAGSISSFAQAPTEAHPSPDVDGYVWMKSTDAEKKAFLFGAGSAVVLEYHVRDKKSEEPSKFVKGWVEAFKDMSWPELATRIDDFYTNNPDRMNFHVFDVIWHEVIKPRLKA